MSAKQLAEAFRAESLRERIVRYLREHPELDDPQITGELRFIITRRVETGRTDVAATFRVQGAG